MVSFHLVLTILAIVCLLLAAVNISTPRVSFGWLGMLFWLLSVSVT